MHRNAGNSHDASPLSPPRLSHSPFHSAYWLKCSVCKSAGFRPIRLFLDRSFPVPRGTCARLYLIAAHITHNLPTLREGCSIGGMIPFNAVVLETFLTRALKPFPLSRSLIYVIYSWECRRGASLVVYLVLVTVINHSLANYIRSLPLLAMEPGEPGYIS